MTISYILSTLKIYAHAKSQEETFQCFLELFAKKFGYSKVGIWKLANKNGQKYTKIHITWDSNERKSTILKLETPISKRHDSEFADVLNRIQSSTKKNTLIEANNNSGFYSGLYIITWEDSHVQNKDLLQMFCETITNVLPVYFQLAQLKNSVISLHNENNLLTNVSSQQNEILSRSQLNYSYQNIRGQSKPLLQVLQYLDRIIEHSDCQDLVYIIGESGTGKSLIARSIHQYSLRCSEPFVEINCGSIVENLTEAEFFGIAPNSGISNVAKEGKPGLFELADKGVLFLDEVSELSLPQQAALLTVTEGKPFRRVCGSENIFVDIRIITASIRDIKKLPPSQFLPELAERLDGIRIQVPPLRERIYDIPILINYFCKQIQHEERRNNITSAIKEVMLRYSWPGNIRQLHNCVRRSSFGIIPEYLDVQKNETIYLKTFDESLTESKEKIIKVRASILLTENPKCSFGELAESLGLNRDSLRRRLQSIDKTWEQLRCECINIQKKPP
ncbi:sigma 54-interacting transcriptional regulator [Candidatus Uabimicrobium sp. HlEnr_7]|uniref:sigma 54-interacting transcriptional regulator n=1 Tax=Candidatus Uabimicrobium helgolandensis TaxID=3095367 RepID=UPI0035582A05